MHLSRYQDAKAREAYWIQKTPRCVNVCVPGQDRADYEEHRRLVVVPPKGHVETRRETIDYGRLCATLEVLRASTLDKTARRMYSYLEHFKQAAHTLGSHSTWFVRRVGK